MACRYTFNGKTYEAHEFDDVLRAMQPSEASKYMGGVTAVPSAPMIGDTKAWTALALKRMIRYAAENGFDKVAWTTGEQQAARYDLSKQVSAIHYAKNSDGTYDFEAIGLAGQGIVIDKVNVPISEVENYLGKDIANKIANDEGVKSDIYYAQDGKRLSGLDLKVGGTGMKGYYDQIVPQVANDVLKKLGGGKVEDTTLVSGPTDREESFHDQQGFTITPELRNKVMTEGIALFQNKEQYGEHGKDIYEGSEQRPGTTDEQRRIGRDAFREILGPYAGREGVSLLGSKIARDFQKSGGSALIGQVVHTPEDLAVLAQVLRDPRFETFRIFYTKDGEIVGHTGITSRMPGAVAIVTRLEGENDNEAFKRVSDEIMRQKQALGADGYWAMHNHPSGRASPSTADIRMTKKLSDNTRGFLGHVVIDHDEYSYINALGNTEEFDKAFEHPYAKDVHEVPHNALNAVVFGAQDLANVGKQIERKEGYFTLVGRDSQGRVASIAEAPLSMLEDTEVGRHARAAETMVKQGWAEASKVGEKPTTKELRLTALLRRFATQTGSTDIFAIADEYGVNKLTPLVRKGLLLDAIDINGKAARSNVFPEGRLFEGGKAYLAEEEKEPYDITARNIGITTTELAKGKGKLAKAAQAVLERAKATKMGAAASEWADAVKTDIQTKVVPMAAGTDRARAIAKDFANADRLARWQWAKFDDVLKKNFTADQREKMWNAAEEENQIRIDKVPEAERKGRGIDKLNPEERATMDTLHEYGQNLLQRARDVGMFKGEGVAYWSPRIIAMIGEDGTIGRPKAEGGKGFTPYSSPTGGNITVTASSLKGRKHAAVAGTEAAAKLRFGEGAQVVRDIRTMPLAMSRVERAIAGKELINQIKEIGKETGQDLTSDSAKNGFFTIDHPAFKTYRYRPDIKMREAFDKVMTDQLMKFAADIGVSHERLAKMGGNIWGKAYMGGDKIETRFGGPETVITHELGHQLDHKYGLADKFVDSAESKKELRALADLRYEGADEVSNYYKKYVRQRSEKIANMVHAYVHAPEKFKAVAPQTYAKFDSFLNQHPELAGLKQIKPSLRLGSETMYKRPPGEDFDVFPVYVSREFEGPLKAIMSDYPGKLYQAFMDMKGKSMSVIMYSPLIHNGVEYGRALPLMPGRIITFKAYFDGAVAKRDPAVMRELINDGMVPIGHRFFMQDISGIMEEPSLKPGRSWTAKIVGGAVGLANKKAGEAVKKGIDVAGDFWHNTLLWDRVGDLQAGIAVNVKADLIKKGMDPQSAGRVASHLANRFAGALPNEAMSANARKVANFMFFSRTFTLGNLGVMKDMISGLPRDVQAQILRDAGPVAAFAAKKASQQAAIKSFATDIALMYGANAALQSGFDALKRDKSLDDIEREYVDRFHNMLQNVKEDPTNLLKPFAMIESLTPMAANEPGKEQRVLYDYDKTGTAIYVRLPTGKIGEEFLSWTTSPLDILKRKEGTVARPLIQTLTNDRGFGRKVYDENLPGYKGAAKAVGNIAWNFLSQQFPIDSLNSALDIARHENDENDALKVIGPLFGLTFSRGSPGGPEVGMMYTTERMHRAEISDAMPDIKRYIKQGNMEDAVKRMYDAHMTPAEISATLKFSQMPRARLSPQNLKKFYETDTPEQRQKMQDIQESRP